MMSRRWCRSWSDRGSSSAPLLQAAAGQRFDVMLNLVPASPEETAALADLAADGAAD